MFDGRGPAIQQGIVFVVALIDIHRIPTVSMI